MSTSPKADQTLFNIAGIRLASISAGIRKKPADDIVLIELCDAAITTAVFTTNAFCAAPVILARKHLAKLHPRFLLVNAGNANAGTGTKGMQAAIECCQLVAEATSCKPEQVLPFSTGVIGEHLPVEKFRQAMPELVSKLSENNWPSAAKAIMTTDTVAKAVSCQCTIDGKTVTITGITKGSGMIRPDMATMLAYIATDACVGQGVLKRCLLNAVDASFNRITVDGDTSTNDACVLIATQQADNPVIDSVNSASGKIFYAALEELCVQLAKAIVKDGEGATKLVTVKVEQGANQNECETVAYTIAHSPLVKTALFASDPNWGRILAAIGRAGLEQLDINKIKIYLDDVCIVRDGGRDPDYQEHQGQQVFLKPEFSINVMLGRGDASTHVWTCDFSYDYVKINAEYRT